MRNPGWPTKEDSKNYACTSLVYLSESIQVNALTATTGPPGSATPKAMVIGCRPVTPGAILLNLISRDKPCVTQAVLMFALL